CSPSGRSRDSGSRSSTGWILSMEAPAHVQIGSDRRHGSMLLVAPEEWLFRAYVPWVEHICETIEQQSATSVRWELGLTKAQSNGSGGRIACFNDAVGRHARAGTPQPGEVSGRRAP